MIEISRWCAGQLKAQHQDYIAGLPSTIEIDLGHAYRLLAFHGSPRSATDYVTATTHEDELDAMLAGAEQEVLAGSHTYVPLVRRHRSQTILNPGSVGLPLDHYGYAGEADILNHAAHGIVSTSESGFAIELRQVAIDRTSLERMVRTSGMPHPEGWLGLRK